MQTQALAMTLDELGRPIKILLVEDNYGDVLLTREACEHPAMNIELTVASDGEDGLALLRGARAGLDDYRPDFILLDLNLPRMDGRELLTVIKNDPDLRRIPVIVLTSSRAEIDILRSYDLKANSYVVKPVEFDRLQEVIASLEGFWRRHASLPTTRDLDGR
jgi:two-component system, chemotaxis family, response regulator Rcp1